MATFSRRPIENIVGTEVEGDRKALDVDDEERALLMDLIQKGAPHAAIAVMLKSWEREPARRPLMRLAERAKAAALLHKGPVHVVVEGHGVRLPERAWRPFFSALVHVVRNAIDHGLEPLDERVRLGKPPAPTLRFSAAARGDEIVIEIADDGCGIDWCTIRARAVAHGLPHATHEDLVEALFADGISSRTEASEYSGRGLGMSAVRQACLALGGIIEVESTSGRGTCVRLRLPNS